MAILSMAAVADLHLHLQAIHHFYRRVQAIPQVVDVQMVNEVEPDKSHEDQD
eukprot:CAMPEP_0202894136 /NCGR_PEP_ID=MMETSP1392-20130828/3588_1 /ASSEMBLY_ACC=CAM_ASM_000868 /TAXON_ID=225041 /ORGANISM="Chlamydomonas chlamydogama, Strain SAG 11-48b" /LENGTH=51 /DNA_ID=CAMNT_0049578723 /DNA_START=250 /DNA_END=405 /DNA_ORIENTATION=+